jgi:preprotein translocase subunit SecF
MVNTIKKVTFMERRRIWFGISALLLVPGIISLLVWHLHLGIDFTGGSLSTYSSQTTQTGQGSDAIKSAFTANQLEVGQIQTDQTSGTELRFFVKSQNVSEDKHRDIVRRLGETQPALTELSFETIDPQVGADVTKKAFEAVALASLAIIAYITLSFRGVPKPASSWQFGIFAVAALLHDVLFILGFFSIMGHFFGWEVNAEFVTAALTVMGFSVHDTIVVFDRLRENLMKSCSLSFRQAANVSVAQTMARSINTSLTVVLVLLAIALLGGTNIRSFTVTLLVGIIVGTYSSIFVATPLLDWWQDVRVHIKPLSLPKRKRSTTESSKPKAVVKTDSTTTDAISEVEAVSSIPVAAPKPIKAKVKPKSKAKSKSAKKPR